MKSSIKHLALYLGICALIMLFSTMPIELVEWIKEHTSIVMFVSLSTWTAYFIIDDD